MIFFSPRRRALALLLGGAMWWTCALAAVSVAQRVQFPTTVPGAPAPIYPPTPAPALSSFPAYDPYANAALGSPPADIPYAAPPPAYGVPYAAPMPPPAPSAPLFQMPSFQWTQSTYDGSLPRGGFYAGFDGTMLEARPGATQFLSPLLINTFSFPTASADFRPDYDFDFAPRVFGGYKGPAGLGIRGRWWFYDHEASGTFTLNSLIPAEPPTPPPVVAVLTSTLNTELSVNSIDLEGTQDGQFHNWDVQFAGGVRYAEIEYDLFGRATGTTDTPDPPLPAPPTPPVPFESVISTHAEFEGVGPTVALAARRPLRYVDGLAFLFNLRTAFLFGDTDANLTISQTPSPPSTVRVDAQEHLIQVWEVQVGFDYGRAMQNGARLFGGAYLEAQIWEWSNPLSLGDSDLGFFGPTFTVGIAR